MITDNKAISVARITRPKAPSLLIGSRLSHHPDKHAPAAEEIKRDLACAGGYAVEDDENGLKKKIQGFCRQRNYRH